MNLAEKLEKATHVVAGPTAARSCDEAGIDVEEHYYDVWHGAEKVSTIVRSVWRCRTTGGIIARWVVELEEP